MTWLRLSTRARVAAAVVAVTAVLLTGLGIAVYWSVGSALLDEVDSGLRFRAEAYLSSRGAAPPARPDPALQEPREAFFQVVSPGGVVVNATIGLPARPLLPPVSLSRLSGREFAVRTVPGVPDTARLLALPLHGGRTLIVGTTLADRSDALAQLALALTVAGPVAIALASLAGWLVAGLGLRPVERMRRQAAAITYSGLDRRLTITSPDREIRQLAGTLNDMLDRLERAARHDREFLERASHELRTPLTALKAELDVAAGGPRTVTALSAAVASASEETDRLTLLANDLLALARVQQHRLPVNPAPTSLRRLLEAAAASHEARAALHGVRVIIDSVDVVVTVDAIRLRQALDDLLDNAIRHGGRLSLVQLTGRVVDDGAQPVLELSVIDDGRGFPAPDALQEALAAPHSLSDGGVSGGSAGLGLLITAAIAAGHGGTVDIVNHSLGAAVVIRLPLINEVPQSASRLRRPSQPARDDARD